MLLLSAALNSTHPAANCVSYFWYPETQTPLPASSKNLCAAQLTRTLQHSYVHHDFGHQTKPCHSALPQSDSQQTFYHWEKITYSVGCNYLPCVTLDVTILCSARSGKLYNLYYRSVRRRVAQAQLHQIRTVYYSELTSRQGSRFNIRPVSAYLILI